MVNHPRLLVLACAAAGSCLLGGCGGSPGDAGNREPMPVEDTVYGGQVKQMDRIRKETSALSEGRMDHLNQQLDSQEEGKAR